MRAHIWKVAYSFLLAFYPELFAFSSMNNYESISIASIHAQPVSFSVLFLYTCSVFEFFFLDVDFKVPATFQK